MFALFTLNIGWHTAIILLMLGAGLAYSLTIALRHIYRYSGGWTFPFNAGWSEIKSLESVRQNVKKERAVLAANDVLDSFVLEKIRKEANPKSLIFDRLLTIVNLQKSYTRIDLDILQSATETKEAANRTLEIPGYFIGIAMLVGLLGTVIGLSVMIGDMQMTLSSLPQQPNLDAWRRNSEKVQEVLGSMQSAFWATIGGLFCSIIASLFNYLIHIYQAGFYKKLDAFTVEELLPLVYRSKDTSDLLNEASENIEKTFSKLQNIGDNITDNTQKLNAVHQSFNSIIMNLERMTQNPMRNEMQQILQQLILVIDETAKANKSMQTTVQYLPRAIEVMEKNHEQNFNALNGFLQSNAKYQERSVNYPPNFSSRPTPPESGKSRPLPPSEDNRGKKPTNVLSSFSNNSLAIAFSAFIAGIFILFFMMWLFGN